MRAMPPTSKQLPRSPERRDTLAITTVTTARARTPFIGRSAELYALGGLLRGDARVVHLHGIAGIGKSALVSIFVDHAKQDGVTVLELDCRTIEPTIRGFCEALGGCDEAALFDHLNSLARPVVLVLDHYELFRLMDTWLRQMLLPRLPQGVSLLLAGRERPVSAWFALAGFRSIPLGPLEETEARSLLVGLGADVHDASRLNRIARGHPLALILAAAGMREHPDLSLEDAASTRVVAELTRLYLADIDDAVSREALEASSVVRRITEPLLAAMLAERSDIDQIMLKLLDLPFVDARRDGLVVHEAVRDAVAEFLRGTNPIRYRRYQQAAWRELRNETRDVAPAELWRYTADMLYLIDNPVVREAFFPSASQPLSVEPATAADGAAVRAIAGRHEGHDAAAIIERWWSEKPEMFSMVRDRDGSAAGFFLLVDGGMLRRAQVRGDPVLETWARDLHDHPLPKGQVALGLRRWLDAENGELPCATQAACWLDVKRDYMALRPALRRMYVVVHDVPTYWPVVEKLGFRPLEDGVVVLDGLTYSTVVLDFRAGSVDGWLSSLVAGELGFNPEPDLDEQARELCIHGKPVALTPLELGVFQHLRQREGSTVSRAELLQEVWDTDYTGGSNVVDAVVRTLRHKLGDAAIIVETIRGSGYRLRADWRAHTT